MSDVEGKLSQTIQQISPAPMTGVEAEEAARNLAGFFELLMEIDREQAAASRKKGER